MYVCILYTAYEYKVCIPMVHDIIENVTLKRNLIVGHFSVCRTVAAIKFHIQPHTYILLY